jgi:fructose-bisphosphate aldolase class II
MLVHIKDIVKKAHQQSYAIGAFNTSNLEVTLGIVQAAVAKRAPVIVQISERTIKYAGLKAITHIVQTIAKNEAVNVPVALHLDHGKSFHSVAETIRAGFSSIMIDQSDENVTLTKQAVDYAHKRGVWAQGELGQLRGKEDFISVKPDKALMTDPNDAVEFVKRTKVDTLAVAIGNIHGIIKMRKRIRAKLDLDRLKAISEKVKIPLVLHGASGLDKTQIQKAVNLGITIINIDTEIRLAFTDTLRHVLASDKKLYDPREVLKPSIKAVQKLVEEKIEMFGSAGKA